MIELEQPKIWELGYDYSTAAVYLEIGESSFHYNVRMSLRDHIKSHIQTLFAAADDPITQARLQSVGEPDAADIKPGGEIPKQPDASFGQSDSLLSLVCKVS